MRYSNDVSYDSIATIQRARAQQLQSMMATRSNFQYSQTPVRQQPRQQQPANGGHGQDTVTLGGNSWGYSNGNATSNPWGYSSGPVGNGPSVNPNNTRMSNGQSIEDIFANPYAGDPDMAYLKEALDKIAAAKRAHGPSTNTKKEGQKGDLRVIAGDRSDGVKPKDVRIDDANNYDYQKSENSYHDNRQEAKFKDGTVGREYDVTVTWEDGSTTKKRVTLKQPNQIVYMNSSYSY